MTRTTHLPAPDAASFPELCPAGYQRRARSLGSESPLLRCVTADPSEALPDPEGYTDPSGESRLSPVPFVVRKHKDRALILAASRCFVHCRFCFRRAQSKPFREAPGPAAWRDILSWLAGHPEVEEVILSGGDPLTLPDPMLHGIATNLASLPHVRRWRIHTRAPVVAPGRITSRLVRALDNGVPLRLVLHTNHPGELGPEVRRAVLALRGGGVELASQAVLLRDVNDDPRVLLELLQRLGNVGVRPYYLHHPDRALGNSRFRVSVRRGLAVYRSLMGRAAHGSPHGIVPPYVLDLPNGCGKTPVANLRAVCTERVGRRTRFRYRWVRPSGWDGVVAADRCEWWDIWEGEE